MLVRKDNGIEIWPDKNKVIGIMIYVFAAMLVLLGIYEMQEYGIKFCVFMLILAFFGIVAGKYFLKEPEKKMMINDKYIEFYHKNKMSTQIQLDKIVRVDIWSHRKIHTVQVLYTENDGKKRMEFLKLKTYKDKKSTESAIREYIDESKIIKIGLS